MTRKSNTINDNITLFLSKYSRFLLCFFISIMSLGMMNPQGPDSYNQTYQSLTLDYNNANANVNNDVNNYDRALRRSFNFMKNSAQRGINLVDRQRNLVTSDFHKANLLFDRLSSVCSFIDAYSAPAKSRQLAVQAGRPGVALHPGDQNILNALTASNNIKQQVQNSWGNVQRDHGQFQNHRNNAHNEFNRINRRNQQLFNNINYARQDIDHYRNSLRNSVTLLVHVNQHVFDAKHTASEIHNQIAVLEQLRQNIRQAINAANNHPNVNIQVPFAF